jgi:hypothetical protein
MNLNSSMTGPEWQCMQLLQTSIALAALLDLPVSTAGLNSTSYACSHLV